MVVVWRIWYALCVRRVLVVLRGSMHLLRRGPRWERSREPGAGHHVGFGCRRGVWTHLTASLILLLLSFVC